MYKTDILDNRYKSLSTELADSTKKWVHVGAVDSVYVYPMSAGKAMDISSCQLDLCGPSVIKNNCEIHNNMFIIYNQKTKRAYQEKYDTNMHTLEMIPVSERAMLLTATKMHKVLILDLIKIQQKFQIVPYFELMYHNHLIELRCLDCGEEAAEWVTECLKRPDLRLGFNKPGSMMAELFWNQFGQLHSLWDNEQGSMICYAELPSCTLVSEKSHTIINEKLSHFTHMQHFTPNIVVTPITSPSFFELEWEWIKIGNTVVRNANPWQRYTNIEPKDLPIDLIMQLMSLTCSVYLPGDMQIGSTVHIRVHDETDD